MKGARAFTILAGLTVTCALAMTQGQQSSSQPARLRLMLVPGDRTDPNAEEIFTIRLSNEGKTSLSFPEPGQLCGNSLDGFVMVYKRILSPSQGNELGRGCIADRLARTNVLAEAKKWKTLAPGGVYEFTVPLRTTLLLNDGTRYALTAKYYPPHLTSAERPFLLRTGLESPDRQWNHRP